MCEHPLKALTLLIAVVAAVPVANAAVTRAVLSASPTLFSVRVLMYLTPQSIHSVVGCDVLFVHTRTSFSSRISSRTGIAAKPGSSRPWCARIAPDLTSVITKPQR